MPHALNPATSYTQKELTYLYCSTCNYKDYRLNRAGMTCNRYMSGPEPHRASHCTGTMTLSTLNNPAIDTPDVMDAS